MATILDLPTELRALIFGRLFLNDLRDLALAVPSLLPELLDYLTWLDIDDFKQTIPTALLKDCPRLTTIIPTVMADDTFPRTRAFDTIFIEDDDERRAIDLFEALIRPQNYIRVKLIKWEDDEDMGRIDISTSLRWDRGTIEWDLEQYNVIFRPSFSGYQTDRLIIGGGAIYPRGVSHAFATGLILGVRHLEFEPVTSSSYIPDFFDKIIKVGNLTTINIKQTETLLAPFNRQSVVTVNEACPSVREIGFQPDVAGDVPQQVMDVLNATHDAILVVYADDRFPIPDHPRVRRYLF